jgi:hypothetical protein
MGEVAMAAEEMAEQATAEAEQLAQWAPAEAEELEVLATVVAEEMAERAQAESEELAEWAPAEAEELALAMVVAGMAEQVKVEAEEAEWAPAEAEELEVLAMVVAEAEESVVRVMAVAAMADLARAEAEESVVRAMAVAAMAKLALAEAEESVVRVMADLARAEEVSEEREEVSVVVSAEVMLQEWADVAAVAWEEAILVGLDEEDLAAAWVWEARVALTAVGEAFGVVVKVAWVGEEATWVAALEVTADLEDVGWEAASPQRCTKSEDRTGCHLLPERTDANVHQFMHWQPGPAKYSYRGARCKSQQEVTQAVHVQLA